MALWGSGVRIPSAPSDKKRPSAIAEGLFVFRLPRLEAPLGTNRSAVSANRGGIEWSQLSFGRAPQWHCGGSGSVRTGSSSSGPAAGTASLCRPSSAGRRTRLFGLRALRRLRSAHPSPSLDSAGTRGFESPQLHSMRKGLRHPPRAFSFCPPRVVVGCGERTARRNGRRKHRGV